MTLRLRVLATLFGLAPFSAAYAQCPDGTPPPCKNGSASPALARRTNPALNERAWIVVPFANVTKAPDLDWLRDASVNLLSLDLSRWTDITVVDDKRVGDLMRELPPTRLAQALTLNDGLALARRAGAGKLVMGDFFKLGKGARLVANVFDVKSGTRLRSITHQSADQDSLLTAFGPLARGVLAVPPPTDAKLGATGTTSVDAYQEYLLGVNALNRFEITEARQHLGKALALDSSFALAHFKLAIAIHWDAVPGDTTERAHARAAARLGASLPPRERALISGRLALANGEYERACSAVHALVAKDSTDVEALYGVGECEYHGGRVPGEPVDSAHGRMRGNWNAAIAAFRRVLTLDPTYHPAFEHILDALSAGGITVCRTFVLGCGNDPDIWTAYVLRDGDSLLIQPVRSGSPEYYDQAQRAARDRTGLLNRRAARKIAQEWVDAGPAEVRAHLDLGTADLLLGDIAQADDEFRQIRPQADHYARVTALQYRVQIAIQLGHGTEGRVLLDSLRRETTDKSDDVGRLASLSAAFGKLQPMAAVTRGIAARDHWSAERLGYTLHHSRIMLGVPGDRTAADERRYWESLQTDSLCPAGLSRCRTTALMPSLAYALRMPRTWWPPFAVEPAGFRFLPAAAVATANARDLRAALAYLDSVSRTRLQAGGDDQATSVIAADAALALHDSSEALRITRLFVDSLVPSLERLSVGATFGGPGDGLTWKELLVPRMMLQRADLAAALGFPDESRTWYARVLDLWADADPELQPTVARIRASLAKVR